MWVGITGRNGSGKDTVALLLAKHGFTPISTSDIIRQEVAARNMPQTRQSIHSVVIEWRTQHGADVLLQKIEQSHHNLKNAVVYSIRHPDEVACAKKHHPDFLLINVTTDPQIRFERSKKRNRENPPKNLQEFLAEEQVEAEKADKRYFDMVGVENIADVIVPNNGTFEELKQHIDQFLTQHYNQPTTATKDP